MFVYNIEYVCTMNPEVFSAVDPALGLRFAVKRLSEEVSYNYPEYFRWGSTLSNL